MERCLVERVVAAQPTHRDAGIDCMVVRDMVTAVVRDIVPILDTLVGRQLAEKKGGVLRRMVADLMTEDLAKTLTMGRERLRQEELGALESELARLQLQLRDREAAWEQRFAVTSELKDSQYDLWAAMDGRYKDMEGRLGVVERDLLRGTDLDCRMQAVSAEFDTMREAVCSSTGKADAVAKSVEDLDVFCRGNYVTAAALDSCSTGLSQALDELRQRTEASLSAYRDEYAKNGELEKSHNVQSERCRLLASELFAATQDIDMLKTQLKRDQRTYDETFATKLEQQAAISMIGQEREDTAKELRQQVAKVERSSARRAELELEKLDCSCDLADAVARASRLADDIESVSKRLVAVEAYFDTPQDKQWASQELVEEVALRHATRAASEVNEKEAVAQLRREFEDERERLRQITRQLQGCRKDINELSEVCFDAKTKTLESSRQLVDLQDAVRANCKKHEETRKLVLGEQDKLQQRQLELDQRLPHGARSDSGWQSGGSRHIGVSLGKMQRDFSEVQETMLKLPQVAA